MIFGITLYCFAVGSGKDLSLPPIKQIAFLLAELPAGLAGVMCAGLLAATMSSIDSGINACATAIWNDFYFLVKSSDNSRQEKSYRLGITISIIIGTIAILLALSLIAIVSQQNTIFVLVNKIIHGLGSPLLGLILVAMFAKYPNSNGIFAGTIFGIIASVLVTIFLKGIAIHYYAVINLLLTLLFVYLMSFIFRMGKRE